MTTPSHETLREQLLDLAYGELGRGEARALEKHLETCAACRAELQGMAQTRSAMSALGQEPAPERGEAILLAAAREAARAQERQRRPFLPSWVWGASLGAVGLVALGIVSVQLVGRFERPGAPPPMDAQVARGPSPEAAQAQPAPARPAVPPASAGAANDAAGEDLAMKAMREEQPAQPPAPARPAMKAKGGGAGERRDDALDRSERAPAPAEPLPDKKAARQVPREDERFAKAPPAKVSAPKSAESGPQAAPAASPIPAPAPPPQAVAEAAPPPAAAPSQERARSSELPKADAPAASAAPAPSADEQALAGATARLGKSEAVGAKRRADAAPSSRRSAAAAAALEDPIARHSRLRAAGRLRIVTRAFPSCAGEAARTVELDEQGAVVKVARRGTRQGQPYEVELFYAEDGHLAAARWSSAGQVREARAAPGAPLAAADGIPPAALQPERAAAAGPDAPPRCAF